MRAPISIIIPTLNAEKELPRVLASLGEGLQAGLIRELVVTDGGSSDATLAIAEAAGALVVSGDAGRGGQLARGANVAAGEWLFFLHADSQLAEGWAGVVVEYWRTEQSAACFRLRFAARGLMAQIVAGWANLRTRLFRLPYGDQGLLVRRGDYDAVGGFPDIPLMEDVALARALPKIVMLPVTIETGADRYLVEGWLRRGTRNLKTLIRYLLGADPKALAQDYARR
ncbi:TIGR04283 family arsenosugar biosynthesis glycosyltransferase [Aliiroseovarius sp. YM-037]|uniref:TIGR04283 family arsenosugar biosynthesis glycosyltransferase n=1 Tax=Aliiroseovarius sp. YM-037 TaxID=3341728 RepID=UPI003A80E368